MDSELDARTSLEIEQHLKACPDCARLFAEEQKLEARLKAGLNRGARTAALWEQIERSVVAAAPSACPLAAFDPASRSLPGGTALLAALGEQLQAGWRRSPWAWAGLAAAWVVILALNFAAREPDAPLVAGQRVPSASEMRFALKQKQLLMAELAARARTGSGGQAEAGSAESAQRPAQRNPEHVRQL